MVKRVFLIHGWGGSPGRDWMPWAKLQLEQLGYVVHAPQMPDADNPEIEAWVAALDKEVSKPEYTDIFIGHSIGCQTILRYLEQTPEGTKVDKIIFVAGWTVLNHGSYSEEDIRIVKPWEETPINFGKVKGKANSFICIFSDNDSDVPFEENNRWFNDNLGVSTILEKGKGHFSEDTGVSELPILLNLLKDER